MDIFHIFFQIIFLYFYAVLVSTFLIKNILSKFSSSVNSRASLSSLTFLFLFD